MVATQKQPDYRRRTPRDLRNRPTRRLLKDRAFLAGKKDTEGLTDAERDELRAIDRELRGHTGGKQG